MPVVAACSSRRTGTAARAQDALLRGRQYAIEVVAKLAASGSLRAARDKRHGSPVSFNWGEFVPESRPNLVVTEHDCHRLLAAFGLQTARGRLAVSEQDVLDAALAVSWPVALKAISPAVTHRAAAGLLALGVTSDDEARAEYRRLIDQAATLAVSLDGVYVQQMEDEGAELLVSAFRDSTFGVVVSCGAGGVMTESLDDVTFELAPVDSGRGPRDAAETACREGIASSQSWSQPGGCGRLHC